MRRIGLAQRDKQNTEDNIMRFLLSIILLLQFSTATIKEKISIKDSQYKSISIKVPTSMRNKGEWDSLGTTPRNYDLLIAQIDTSLDLFPVGYLASTFSVYDTATTDINYNSGLTSSGHVLKYIRIASDTTKPIAFFTGSMHGGHEWQHGYCWRDLLAVFADNINSAFCRNIFSRYQLVIIPTLNTYGCFTSSCYTNYNYVNLMKNFDEEWSAARDSVGDRWTNPGYQYYKGQKGFSEPETRMVKLLAETFGGLHTIALYYENHSAGDCVTIDRLYATTYWSAAWDSKLRSMASDIVAAVSRLYPNSSYYPPTGYTEGVRGAPDVWPFTPDFWDTTPDMTSLKWFNANFGCPSFIVEIGTSLMASPESYQINLNELYEEFFNESVLQAIFYFLLDK